MTVAAERDRSPASLKQTVADIATLVRFPNLFTAPPDVIAGAALAAVIGASVDPVAVGGLCLASMLVYAAGTTLNDVADVAEDARERPNRPIPSGAVDRRTALALGLSFLVGGVALAAAVDTAAGVTAAALASAVVLYDFVLKDGRAGPLAMGAARGLNVALGLSVLGSAAFGSPVVMFPVVLACYVASLTWMAESETGETNRFPVVLTGAVTLTAGAVAVGLVSGLAAPLAVTLAALFALGFATWVGRALASAYTDPVPATIGQAVGTAVLGIVLVDAAVAAVVPLAGALAVAFVLPAVGFARWFDVT